MDRDNRSLYYCDMITISPDQLRPKVRYANFFYPERGAAWRDRTIPDFELIFIDQGRFSFESFGKPPLHLVRGDLLLIYPEEHHSFTREGDEDPACISCIHLEFSDIGSWGNGVYRLERGPERLISFRTDDETEEIRSLFLSCSRAFESTRVHQRLECNCAAQLITLRLASYWESIPKQPEHRVLMEMVCYIRENIDKPLRRQDLADQFAYSPEHISRLFRKHLGISLCRCIRREKIYTAYRLMHEQGLSAKETAYRLGFDDPAYFSRVFRSVMLCSPSTMMKSRE